MSLWKVIASWANYWPEYELGHHCLMDCILCRSSCIALVSSSEENIDTDVSGALSRLLHCLLCASSQNHADNYV